MYADDSLIKAVTGGDGASFQPLAQLQPRQMTAIAKKNAQVLRVNRSLLEQLLSVDEAPAARDNDGGVEVEELESDQSGDWLMTLLQSELFTRIPPSNIPGVLDTLETINVASGDSVVTQGEPGDFYYAVQSGRCEVVRTGPNDREIKLAELSAGDTFGDEATKERESAEAAKARAEEELVRARAQHAERAQLNEPVAIDEIELRANAATENLEQAIQAVSVADSAARDNEDELERTYSTANEINVLLEKELDDWVGEKNDLQESTIQREVLSRQKEMVERIRARAAEMKSKTEADNKSLLEEVEDQLGKD